MLVIDSGIYASVIVKDEFYEACSKYILQKKSTLDLTFAEAGNVIWKHVKMERINAGEITERAEMLRKLVNTSRVYKTEDCIVEAAKLAVDYDLTVYDALFIALAVKLNTKLITTDEKLYDKIKETELGIYVECVKS